MRARQVWVVSAVMALGVLSGCGSGGANDDRIAQPAPPSPSPSSGRVDSAAKQACTTLDSGFKPAKTAKARSNLAAQIAPWAESSATVGIREAGAELAASAPEAAAWKTAAGEFKKLCTASGWSAPDKAKSKNGGSGDGKSGGTKRKKKRSGRW